MINLREVPLSVGLTVRVNMMGLGFPYLAAVEKIDGERVLVRPYGPVLTEGSARRSRTRNGPSVRARWVKRTSVVIP